MNSISQPTKPVPRDDVGYDFSKVTAIDILAELEPAVLEGSEQLVALQNQNVEEVDVTLNHLGPALGLAIRFTHEYLAAKVQNTLEPGDDTVLSKANRTLHLAENEARDLLSDFSGDDVLDHLYDAVCSLRYCHVELELGNLKKAAIELNPSSRSIGNAIEILEAGG